MLGFSMWDGWYQILYGLSLALQEYALRHPELSLEVMQVKSKFGRLRIHLNQHNSDIDEMTSHTCQLAEDIDDVSGIPKKLSVHFLPNF